MGDRYFIAAGWPEARQEELRRALESRSDLVVAIDRAGMCVVTERNAATINLDGQGIVIGTVHTAGRREALTELSRDMAGAIMTGRGELLVRAYWGNYVAVFPAPRGEIDLVRAPLGALPCLHMRDGSGFCAASDVDLLKELGGYVPRIAWDAVLRFAISPDLRFDETCLVGLTEVRGGDRLTIGTAALGSVTLWSPWSFATAEREFDDRADAAGRLRDAIVAAMGCTAADVGRGVVLLSGGLDSSIVTASAAASGFDIRCATVSTHVPAGDERSFARRTADRAGVALAERRFELSGIDLARSEAAGLPRPVARAFEYEGRRQARLEAQAFGAPSILSGGGGDNIFCSLQSVVPAVDALDRFDNRREFWRVSRELSAMTGATLFTVAWRAWRRSHQRHRQYPMRADFQFLHPATEANTALNHHSWLQRPPTVLQGKGAHVAGLLGVQMLTEDTDPRDPLCLKFPLLAQPVVELCLRCPTWFWYDRGCNRAVARHAFSGDLPPDIAWRRSKGTPDGFVVEIYDTFRAEIRAMLCEGNLAAHNLVDVAALVTVLDDPRPVRGTDHGRIMRLVDIEAWTRTWPG